MEIQVFVFLFLLTNGGNICNVTNTNVLVSDYLECGSDVNNCQTCEFIECIDCKDFICQGNSTDISPGCANLDIMLDGIASNDTSIDNWSGVDIMCNNTRSCINTVYSGTNVSALTCNGIDSCKYSNMNLHCSELFEGCPIKLN